jgi:lysophospholipase L1-like esterase
VACSKSCVPPICVDSLCHATIQVAVRSPWTVVFLALSLGCGEGGATRVKAPPLEVAPAPPDRAAGATELPPLVLSNQASIASAGSAGPMPGAPLSSAPVGHLEGPDHLARFFDHLATLDAGSAHDDVRVLQYGDSHTASDLGTAAVRKLLQSRFGDGGRGFVSIGKPWNTYWQDGIHGGMSPEFEPLKTHVKDNRVFGDGCYGLLGVGIGADAGGARAWTEVTPRFSRVELDYWQEPHGGSFDVFVDGAHATRVATRALQAGSGFFAFDVADAPHQIELRTVGDGEVRIFGMALDRSQAGVVVDALGINGAQIFTALRWSEEHFGEQLRHRAPDLVVLAYGTNEAVETHLEDAVYERGLVDLLGRVARAAPGSSCLLLGPPDLARWTKGTRGYHTWPRVLEIAAIQRRVAQAAGCGFYDQVEAMGGPGSMAAWAEEAQPRAQQDRMHLTRTGYAEVGTSLATDMLHAYDEWRAEMSLPPTGSEKTWNVAKR